jgi:hypothetical protein
MRYDKKGMSAMNAGGTSGGPRVASADRGRFLSCRYIITNLL